MKTLLRASLLACALLVAVPLPAQTFRERLQEMRDASRRPAASPPTIPAGAGAIRDVSYGDDPRQRYDVYLPANARRAPVILFVHGGGWANGNKDNPGVVENKAAYWLPKGYVLVSINYRMRPDTAPLDQARDVARALADVQKRAPSWHADPAKVMLMGHSAGAHLAALVGASSRLWREAGATRPRGVVSLDSGALDVPRTMQNPPLPGLFDRAFGKDRDDWIAASPYHQLGRDAVPMLFVCSSRRNDACPQGCAMAGKAKTLGIAMEVLPEDLSHGEINRLLGEPSAYTEAVANFIAEAMRYPRCPCTFDAPPRIAYTAWTATERLIQRWASKSRGVQMRPCDIDARTGRGYSVTFGRDVSESMTFFCRPPPEQFRRCCHR